MIRVDNASIPKGKTITISVKSEHEPIASVFSIDSFNLDVVSLQTTVSHIGDFWNVSINAPAFDGFLLIKIGSQRIVKKVGFPMGLFVIGHKSTASSIQVYQLDSDGQLIQASTANKLSDGFYATRLSQNCVLVKAFDKLFDVRGYGSNLGIDVDMSAVTLQTISILGEQLPMIDISSISIPDINLEEIQLSDITIPTTTITEL